MPRPRRDGSPTRPVNKRKLTELYVKRIQPQPTTFAAWDTLQGGLALVVRPNGYRAYKCVYSFQGRVRWYHLAAADEISLEQARELAHEVMYAKAKGKDPQAEKRAKRSAGTFGELVELYFEQHAKKKNRSWQQAHYLVRKHLLPKWSKLVPAHIVREHLKALMRNIEAPMVANQALAVASAIFSWAIREEVGGIKVNPCTQIDRNPETSRARVLSDSELPRFWSEFEAAGLAGKALQLTLLLGQRPGEVRAMRYEHLVDGWWMMPGQPQPSSGWPGTKNGQGHRVWLPPPALAVVGELERRTGFVLADRHGQPVERLDKLMRRLCRDLAIETKVTPHDLRRTHGTFITRLGFGREAMNRIQNHKEGGIADVYDQHHYGEEMKRAMEAVSSELMRIVEGRAAAAENVVQLRA